MWGCGSSAPASAQERELPLGERGAHGGADHGALVEWQGGGRACDGDHVVVALDADPRAFAGGEGLFLSGVMEPEDQLALAEQGGVVGGVEVFLALALLGLFFRLAGPVDAPAAEAHDLSVFVVDREHDAVVEVVDDVAALGAHGEACLQEFILGEPLGLELADQNVEAARVSVGGCVSQAPLRLYLGREVPLLGQVVASEPGVGICAQPLGEVGGGRVVGGDQSLADGLGWLRRGIIRGKGPLAYLLNGGDVDPVGTQSSVRVLTDGLGERRVQFVPDFAVALGVAAGLQGERSRTRGGEDDRCLE